MPRFEVCIIESRELVFVVEADTNDEAFDIAADMDTPDAVRDSFRERTREWVELADKVK